MTGMMITLYLARKIHSMGIIDNTQYGYYHTYMEHSKINISDALFSKVRQKVLGLMYSHPDKDFHTNEIIRQTKSGTGAVQRELENLTAVKLLTMKQIGNQKRYQVNHFSPLFAELRLIVLKTFGLADILKEALHPIADQVRIAFVYGSIAKKEDTALSDIDLMLIGDNLTYADVFQYLEEPEIQLERKINPTFYSTSDWRQKHRQENNFIVKILEQPKIFLIGTEDELKELG
jgi:predicted nucleotidyltransferase